MIRKRRASIVGGNKKGFTVTDPAGLQRVIPFGDGTKLVTDDGGATASTAFVPATRTITAGAGLTGGGDLSANRTIDVGAGTGITVNANDVAVNQSVLKLDDFAAPDDNTDLNVSTSAHGLTPKLPNDATKYLDGTGAYSVPAGSGGAVTKIEEQTPSGTGTLTFSSLGSYTHLEIRFTARSDRSGQASEDISLQFNGDTATNYDNAVLYNSAATTAAAAEGLGIAAPSIATVPAATAVANRATSGTVLIYDYRGTTFNKIATTESHGANQTSTLGTLERHYGVTWRNTAAITSIRLFLGVGNFVSGSKFTLYGYS